VEPGARDRSPPPAPTYPGAVFAAGLRLPISTHQCHITRFERFLSVDLQREKLTVKGHAQAIARFLKWLGKKPVTRDTLRDYLDTYRDASASTYSNQLKSLKVFFREYLGRPDLVATFRFPEKPFEPPTIPPKKRLQQFYYALEPLDLRVACYFMLYATSGWRRREVMALHREDVDLEARILTHRVKRSTTKGRLIGCINEEAQDVLRRCMHAALRPYRKELWLRY
jgi:integrase